MQQALERAQAEMESLGGVLQVESPKGQGTRLRIAVPLRSRARRFEPALEPVPEAGWATRNAT